MRIVWLLLLLAVLLVGCARPKIDIVCYSLINPSSNTTLFEKSGETYVAYEDLQAKLTAGLFQYKNIIVLDLGIFNKTNETLLSQDYSIGLFDGRDLKKIRLLKREDIVGVKAKSTGGPSGDLQAQALQTAINVILETVKPSERAFMLKSFDVAIDNYFSFRPIYAYEERAGLLCFFLDFKAEYPNTLIVTIKDKPIILRFQPIEAGSGGVK